MCYSGAFQFASAVMAVLSACPVGVFVCAMVPTTILSKACLGRCSLFLHAHFRRNLSRSCRAMLGLSKCGVSHPQPALGHALADFQSQMREFVARHRRRPILYCYQNDAWSSKVSNHSVDFQGDLVAL